ncbi:MAG: hypothetical protein U0R78_12010 [Nocardioidaceae bacterium]
MFVEPPTEVSQDHIDVDVREIEAILQAPPMDLVPWPGAQITLKDGRTMLIREAELEEAPAMMSYMRQVMAADHDFYDVVGARVHAELAGWYRKRLKDPYTLVGLIDGDWVGLANGRLVSQDINISLHTMALARGGRIGAIMYYAKAYYAFEILKNQEFWATYESYNGWKRWGLGMAQPSYPGPTSSTSSVARASSTSPRSTGTPPSRTTCSRWSARSSTSTSTRRCSRPTRASTCPRPSRSEPNTV